MEAILNQEVIYLYSIPFFSAIILLEALYSYLGHKDLYTKHDTLTNLIFAVVNILLDLLMKGFSFWVLSFFYHRKLFELSHGWFYWIACFVITDFLYYIHHCVDHKSRFFWAVHVTHHNSDHFNITTGFRSPVFQPLYRYLFFIPAAWMGFEPLHIMFCYALGQIYGTLIHTQSIGKLGPLEWIFITPSHHRVHHACNIKYLDRNMGMVLILWDKIFGTFEKECPEEPVFFGLTSAPEHKNPIFMIFHEWRAIAKDLAQPGLSWSTRFKYIFYPPGWRHEGESFTTKTLQKKKMESAPEILQKP